MSVRPAPRSRAGLFDEVRQFWVGQKLVAGNEDTVGHVASVLWRIGAAKDFRASDRLDAWSSKWPACSSEQKNPMKRFEAC